jgi:hypothetical protein
MYNCGACGGRQIMTHHRIISIASTIMAASEPYAQSSRKEVTTCTPSDVSACSNADLRYLGVMSVLDAGKQSSSG